MPPKNALIDIVLPPELTEASASALKLCELFLGDLIDSTEKPITLSVDLSSKFISCNDNKLKESVRLLVGARQFELFADQLVQLLHKTTLPGSIGELRFLRDGGFKGFVFFGDIRRSGWKITTR